MKNTQVTIIMPCYNAGKYVKTAIDSVLDQGLPVQLIAVDDGSTDNTLDVLTAYSGDIQVVQADHGGVASARNEAINHVKSCYTLLLDADDALAPGSLGWLLQQINKGRSEVIYGNFSSWDSSMRKKLHLHKPVRLGKSPITLLSRRNISPPGAILFPSDAFAKVGNFDQSVASCEDWDFVVRLARAGYSFRKLNREIFHYRRLLSSASNQVHRMLMSGLEVVRRCHYADPRVTGDLYPQGYEQDRMDINLFYCHVACMGLAALAPANEVFAETVRTIKVPANVDWAEFRTIFNQSIWWNSLALAGDQPAVMLTAMAKSISVIRQVAGEQEWCADMLHSLLTPDFRELLRRPGPKKALRLFREWRMARQLITKTGGRFPETNNQ